MRDASGFAPFSKSAIVRKSSISVIVLRRSAASCLTRLLLALVLVQGVSFFSASAGEAQQRLNGRGATHGRTGGLLSRNPDNGPAFCPRPVDEIWIISSRDVCSRCDTPCRLQVSRIAGNCQSETTLDELVQAIESSSGHQNIFYIHGNNTDACWAEISGKAVYQLTCGDRCCVPPVRFVIWSWPSEESGNLIKRPVRDFRRNLDRSPLDGHWFGYVLSRLPDEADPLIFTYSLGCQIGLTALSSPAVLETGRQYRMMCMAPVTRCDWPCNECDLAAAISSLRSLNVVFNRKDIALRGYQVFCRLQNHGDVRSGPECLACSFANAFAIDVACEQGCEHNVVKYSRLPSVLGQFDMAITAGQFTGDEPVVEDVLRKSVDGH